MGLLFNNWHLKIGALALATILYTGFVYSGSFTQQTFPGVVVRGLHPPRDGLVSEQLGTVDVTYRLATGGAPVDDTSFVATVDLGEYDMERAGEVQTLDVSVRSLHDGVTILSFAPRAIPVTIDVVETTSVEVEVDRGPMPSGFTASNPVVTPRTVEARGPRSELARLDRAVASVQVDASGVDFDGPVELRPVDASGQRLERIELTPAVVTVRFRVDIEETTKTVPVTPTVQGTPAAGFAIASVSADPPTVTLRGTRAVLGPITSVATEAVSAAGLTGSATSEAALSVPDGARLEAGSAARVTVTVEIEETTVSRSFTVGLVCSNAPSGWACLPGLDQVSVTLSGPGAAIAALSAADLTATLDVGGLGAGSHSVEPSIPSPPDGVELQQISPSSVSVVLQPPATPAPSPTAAP